MVYRPAAEKAVGYVRVSSDEQAQEGVSLDAQEARVRAFATARGLELVALFREEGVSGKTPLAKRPEGSKLVAALAKGRARHVIVVKQDRLFRDTADALMQSQRWLQAKCFMHILDMGDHAVDTASVAGFMSFGVTALFGDVERKLCGERTRAALRHLKAEGRAYTNFTPFGFDRVDSNLVPNVQEMKAVKRIKAMRAKGASLRTIADYLHTSGVPTKRGGRWHAVTVESVLKIHATSTK